MLKSVYSSPDSQDDHLRSLLDQRAARAQLHSRYSAVSQYSDTPSVYSRAAFQSPRTADDDLPFSPIEPSSRSAMPPSTRRFNLDDPAASMLDMGDDPRASVIFTDDYDNADMSEDDDEPLTRMSMLGPKMRFHSRAPWETDEGPLPKHQLRAEPALSGIRQSIESSRSRTESTKSKSSATSNRGALYALAQESLSTTSLAFKPSRHFHSFDNPLSFDNNMPHQGRNDALYKPTTPSNLASQTNLSRSNSFSSSLHPDDDVHPYANPELVIPYAQEDPISYIHSQSISRSASIATVTDSRATDLRASSDIPPMSDHSRAKVRTSSIQGRDISLPIAVTTTAPVRHSTAPPASPFVDEHQPVVIASTIPGWTEPVPPTFSLISLEEARAQRSRSATAQPTVTSKNPSSSSVPFPDMDQHTPHTDSLSLTRSTTSNSITRIRSSSAGAKAKSALQSIASGVGVHKHDRQEASPGLSSQQSSAAPPTKTLKHRKSGFLRLFNGGKPDKDEKPPPVPPLSGAAAALSTQVNYNQVKISIQRVPPPEPYPSPPPVVEAPKDVPHDHIVRPVKRPYPPLSIITSSDRQVERAPATAVEESIQTSSSFSPERPWLEGSAPQSAPANVSEFPSLKLRPISTIFSEQFGDIVIRDSRPSLDIDVGTTPGSSTHIISPITPGSSFPRHDQSGKDQLLISPISEEEGSDSMVRAVQEQMASAKVAWQRQIWELEGQLRDLRTEMDAMRVADDGKGYCEACGRGKKVQPPANDADEHAKSSVLNRPRARTGTSSRFGSAIS